MVITSFSTLRPGCALRTHGGRRVDDQFLEKVPEVRDNHFIDKGNAGHRGQGLITRGNIWNPILLMVSYVGASRAGWAEAK